MGVAHVGVLARLERHGPRLRAHEADGCRLVDPRALEMEVVDRRLVGDLDHVGAVLQLGHFHAGLLERDREAGADGAVQRRGRRRCERARHDERRNDRGKCNKFHDSPRKIVGFLLAHQSTLRGVALADVVAPEALVEPGAAEISQIGGNIACNAGGPHAFKYGVTGNWVTGIEAVIPPGVIIRAGGPVRKDVAGYDVKSLLIGSEGTLGVITAAWLRLVPAPEAALPVGAFYDDAATGCAAIEAVLGNGRLVSALEVLADGELGAPGRALPQA